MTYVDHGTYESEQRKRRSSIKEIQNSNNYGGLNVVIVLFLGIMTVIGFFAAAIQMTMTMTTATVITVTAFTPIVPAQYATRHHQRNSNTRIFLEDWVANMIDGELFRQDHHDEYEEKWMEKNKAAVLSRIDVGAAGYPSMMVGEEDREAMVEHRRDERMAFTKPEKYCADRCVATGNCDILEDFYELGPEDVIKFCEECVLNNDDENIEDGAGCVLPDAFYDKEPPLRP